MHANTELEFANWDAIGSGVQIGLMINCGASG
jgi:hypothetical protein